MWGLWGKGGASHGWQICSLTWGSVIWRKSLCDCPRDIGKFLKGPQSAVSATSSVFPLNSHLDPQSVFWLLWPTPVMGSFFSPGCPLPHCFSFYDSFRPLSFVGSTYVPWKHKFLCICGQYSFISGCHFIVPSARDSLVPASRIYLCKADTSSCDPQPIGDTTFLQLFVICLR